MTTSIRKFFRTWTHQGALSILAANSLATPPPQGPLPCPPRPWRPQWAASPPRPPRIPSATNLGQEFLLRDWDIIILYNIYNLCMHICVICMCPDDFNGPANNSWFPAHWLFVIFWPFATVVRRLENQAQPSKIWTQRNCWHSHGSKSVSQRPQRGTTSNQPSIFWPKQLTTSRTHNAAFLIILHAPVVF